LTTRNTSPNHAVRTEKLTCIPHETYNRSFTQLIGDKTDNAGNRSQRLLSRKLDVNATLASTHKPPKKDCNAAL